jgi:YD repeat-containing protein
VNFDTAMPDVTCYTLDPFGNKVKATCNGPLATLANVSSIGLPDGRSYTFQYGAWGNLTQVTEPNGRVLRYAYGNASNSTYAANSLPVAPHTTAYPAPTPYTGQEINLQGYGLTSTTSYPQGLSGPGYTTTTTFTKKNVNPTVCSQVDWAGAVAGLPAVNALASAPCCIQVWREDTEPDGTVERTGACALGDVGYTTVVTQHPSVYNGLTAGTETVSASGALMKANYYVNSAGGWYYQYDLDPSFNHIVGNSGQTTYAQDYPLDRRTTRIDSYKDGLSWSTTTTYGDAIVPAPGGIARNTLNVTGTAQYDPSGTLKSATQTSFLHYLANNILRLQASTSVLNASGVAVTRTDTHYDEVGLAGSGQPNLVTGMGGGSGCPAGLCRGNPTTTITYASPSNAAGPIPSRMYYFDNGVVQKTQNPLDGATGRFTTNVTGFNFGACATNPLITTTVLNALSHATSTVTDCYSGTTLSTEDPNANRSCVQVDGLGRVVETAEPGDTLSAQAQCSGASSPTGCYVRDTANCAAAGTTIGNGGQGATTWKVYYPFGLGGVTYNQARTVSMVRNGTSNGHQQVDFVDGLGRTIEQCSEVDPAVSGGNAATCTNTVYDNRGRIQDVYSAYFVASMPSAAAAPPATDQYTETHYDGVGRVTSTQLMKQGVGELPATTTIYSVHPVDGGNFHEPAFGTWVVDANGVGSEVDVDVLGRAIMKWTKINTSSTASAWTITRMQYDAADRLTTITDPEGNLTSYAYDGLGRKTEMADPDRGAWGFAYDNNGNMIQQTDAREAVTYMHYDALNRLTLRDLPYLRDGTWVSGTPGVEDEFTYWDGALPSGCYSCNDHCSTTTDTCNTATLACTHSGTACASPNQ